MDDLRQALFEQIYDYLQYEVFPVEHTGNTIIDLAFNYIHFARREKKLYRSLYLEEYGGGKEMQKFLLYLLCEYSETGPSLRGSFRRTDRILA